MIHQCKDCEKNYGNLKQFLQKHYKGCHDHCPIYKFINDENLKIKHKKAKQNALTCQIYDCETRVMRKLGIRK